MLRRTVLAGLILGIVGCGRPIPPTLAPVRDATRVNASFDETWNAVIDYFAAANIPIATIERASGIIATSRLSVNRAEAMRFADCGAQYPTQRAGGDNPYAWYADSVIYNVLVRGDGATSTVRVTASWDTSSPTAPFTCETTGQWESDVEAAVKNRAET